VTPRIRDILSWYGADDPGTLSNLARLLNHGRPGGAGKLVVRPVAGGAAEFDEHRLPDEIRSIHAGGGFGSILGRNSFQRPRAEALHMLRAAMDIYAAASAAADAREAP